MAHDLRGHPARGHDQARCRVEQHLDAVGDHSISTRDDREKLLTDATGVLENHEGDASRYNTPSKRRRDLRDMFRYVSGNPCYEFSVGGVLSLLIPVRANADIAMGEWVPISRR